MYCRTFSKLYRNAKLAAFDTNFGASFGENVEIFAIRGWTPHNAIKFYEYDFVLQTLKELYEIPIDEDKLDKIVDIQLVRISDLDLSYALLIDWCAHKEILTIKFTRKLSKKQTSAAQSGHFNFDTKACLIGKYDLLCPNLVDSKYTGDNQCNFIVNQQVRLVSQHKTMGSGTDMIRDGFSVLIDQLRFDFDYKFYSNMPTKDKIHYCY